jgi:amino acid transporter
MSDQDIQEELQRTITWKGAFWVASGVPALVLFSIGGIAATVGAPSSLIWTVSIIFGFIQSFIYAEIAGIFPSKSGGASVYGAMAWLRYSKFIAPISVWCNWLAWTPVLSIGSGLAAGYILTLLFPANALINTWQLSLVDLGFLKEDLVLRINAQFLIAAALLMLVFALQHHGILRAAKIQMVVGIAVLLPLLIVGIVPLLTGDVTRDNFTPFVPLSGTWDLEGWTLLAGGMLVAAWSTYAFETAVCYTREFRMPERDTFRAIFFSGLLCMVVFILVPLSFQGALGVDRLTADPIVAGTGVAAAMADMVGGGAIIQTVLVVMLILALLLSIMTSMAGSSRTLYQGAVDGWLPRYLRGVNRHGAPTRGMWTDFGFNIILLLMSNYTFVLAVSSVCYLVFNFLNLNAGWIHRIDRPDAYRPWRAPTILMAVGVFLAFVNALFLGWGANTWGQGTFITAAIAIALIIPVFLFRHYVQDKGVFPDRMYEDLQAEAGENTVTLQKRAGFLPYVALAGGVTMVVIGAILANLAL